MCRSVEESKYRQREKSAKQECWECVPDSWKHEIKCKVNDCVTCIYNSLF